MSRRKDGYHWRLAATGLSFTVFGLGSVILGYVLLPLIALISRDKQLRTRRCRRVIHYSFRFFIGIMSGLGVLTWRAQGEEALKGSGQLLIANHPSLIDIVFLIGMSPNASCIVKSALFANPITRGPVSWAGYIPNSSGETLLDDCEKVLAQGANLIIFPEGTRSVAGSALKFRRGAAYVWQRSRCPLLLATITVTPPTLAKHERWYQVPVSRPHFELAIRPHNNPAVPADVVAAEADVRKVNRAWQNYFERELKL